MFVSEESGFVRSAWRMAVNTEVSRNLSESDSKFKFAQILSSVEAVNGHMDKAGFKVYFSSCNKAGKKT